MPDPARVVEKAMALRSVEPELWGEFVLAVREYAAALAMEVLKHGPETLLRAQGMAIAINELGSVLHAAPQLYEKMKERKQHG